MSGAAPHGERVDLRFVGGVAGRADSQWNAVGFGTMHCSISQLVEGSGLTVPPSLGLQRAAVLQVALARLGQVPERVVKQCRHLPGLRLGRCGARHTGKQLPHFAR